MNLTKIEETASGAVACQMIDMLFPDVIPMQRVNFAAKDPYEYTKNYKILQTAFLKCNISKNIDVDRLIKGRPQDNLEFMQWLKKFWDQNTPRSDYNPEERRSMAKGGKEATSTSILSRKNTSITQQSRPSSMASSPKPGDVAQPTSKRIKTTPLATTSKRVSDLEHDIAELKMKLEESNGEMQKQQLVIRNLEGERDFYNQKLVSIDELLNTAKTDETATVPNLIEKITSILYSESKA
ncbi:hypothetical protein WA171_004554, partial [Blastocystis sp. BT1]